MIKRLAWRAAHAALLLGALVGTGCGGDDDPNGGAPDGGAADSGSDAGMTDAGVDGGTVDLCPDNTEGCECTSSFVLTQQIDRDTCSDPELLCVPWSTAWEILRQQTQSGPPTDFREPFATCVRPCQTDADCGADRFCSVNNAFGGALARTCVDSVTSVDNYCGLAKVRDGRHPDLPLETSERMVGCAGGHACQTLQFTALHPTEGICFDLCQNDAECAGFADTPLCNARQFRQDNTTNPEFIGVCSSTITQVGELCGGGPEAVFSFTTGCDNSNAPTNEAICLPNAFGAGVGICWSTCDDVAGLSECPEHPILGPQACNTELGLCSAGCDPFGDGCALDAAGGIGSTCLGFNFGNPPTEFASLCARRLEPPLTETTVLPSGEISAPQGDQCNEAPTDVLRCPGSTSCVVLQETPASRETGCVTTCRTSTAAGIPTCPELTGVATSTCVEPPPEVPVLDGDGFCTSS